MIPCQSRESRIILTRRTRLAAPQREAGGGKAGRPGAVSYSVAPSFDYIPALDGLRAASIVLVVVGHAGLRHLFPGGFGVTVFFFVSGFLITRQVLAEQEARGQLRLGSFYMRRVLRLYPALLVFLAIGGLVFVALGGSLSLGQILAGVFYFTNYYQLNGSYVGVPDGMYNPFAVLWSLAVEEHYYLVYPLLVVLFGRTRLRFAAILAAGIVAVTLWRFHLAHLCATAVPVCIGEGLDGRILEGTDTRVDSILYGALLAVLLGTRIAGHLLAVLRRPMTLVAGIVLLCLSFTIRDPVFRDSGRFTLQGIGLFLGIGATLFSAQLGWIRVLLSLRPVLLVGRWSYSLYLWHSMVLVCVVAALPAAIWRDAVVDGRVGLLWGLVGMPAVAVLSLGTAGLSYTYVETPMVALRRRFGSHAVRDGLRKPNTHALPV